MIKHFLNINILCCFLLSSVLPVNRLQAQDYEAKSVLYNTLVGGFSGAIGAMINKPKNVKPLKAFVRSFLTGCGGGVLVYSGKKMNMAIAQQNNVSYAWLSRAVFSAGNSIVENASSYRAWWSRFHYDIGFVRFEVGTNGGSTYFKPQIMAFAFGSFLFTAFNGRFDAATSLRSGALVFTTDRIKYASYLVGSTTGNNILFIDTLERSPVYHEVFAHEMVHTFQFQELSGANYFFNPWTASREQISSRFKTFNNYVYGDVNYGLMLVHYFFVQGGIRKDRYCRNFLENEAEVLTTGRVSCP